MPFPENIDELRKSGYDGPTGKSTCKCGAALAWWTTPRKKKMPMDAGTARPHFARCPFWKKKKRTRCAEVAPFNGFKMRCILAHGHASNHRDENSNAWATTRPTG